MKTEEEEEKAVAVSFLSKLTTLTLYSKAIIDDLTRMATESVRYAHIVAKVTEQHLLSVKAKRKLPVLYLIDSIVKNVKGVYVVLFQQHIVSGFCAVFEKVDAQTRAEMLNLRKTWNEIFAPTKLKKIDKLIPQIEGGWTINKSSLHIQDTSALPDSSDLSAPAQAAGSSTDSLSNVGTFDTPKRAVVEDDTVGLSVLSSMVNATEAQLREQLLIKQRELAVLQKKAVESELLQAKSKLEEQDRMIKTLQERVEQDRKNLDMMTRPKSIEGYVAICNHCGLHSSDLHECDTCDERILPNANLILDPRRKSKETVTKPIERRHSEKSNVEDIPRKGEKRASSQSHEKSKIVAAGKPASSQSDEKSKIVAAGKRASSHGHEKSKMNKNETKPSTSSRHKTETSKLITSLEKHSKSKSNPGKQSSTKEKVNDKSSSSSSRIKSQGSKPDKMTKLSDRLPTIKLFSSDTKNSKTRSLRIEETGEEAEFKEGYVVRCEKCGNLSANLRTCDGIFCNNKFPSNPKLLPHPKNPLSSHGVKRPHSDNLQNKGPTAGESKKRKHSSMSKGQRVEKVVSSVEKSGSKKSGKQNRNGLGQNESEKRPKTKKGFAVRCSKCGKRSLDLQKCDRCGKKIPSNAKLIPEPTKKSTPTTIKEPVEEILIVKEVELNVLSSDEEARPGPSKKSTSKRRRTDNVTSTKTPKRSSQEPKKNSVANEDKTRPKTKEGYVVRCRNCGFPSLDLHNCSRCRMRLLLPDPPKPSGTRKPTSIITQAVVGPPEEEITIISSDDEGEKEVPRESNTRAKHQAQKILPKVVQSGGQKESGQDSIRPKFIDGCVVRCKNCKCLSSDLHICSKCKWTIPTSAIILPHTQNSQDGISTITKTVETVESRPEVEISVISSDEEDEKYKPENETSRFQNSTEKINSNSGVQVSGNQKVIPNSGQNGSSNRPQPQANHTPCSAQPVADPPNNITDSTSGKRKGEAMTRKITNLEQRNVTHIPKVGTPRNEALFARNLNQEIVMKALEEQFQSAASGQSTSFACRRINVGSYCTSPRGLEVFAVTFSEIGILFDIRHCENTSMIRCTIPVNDILTIHAHFAQRLLTIGLSSEYAPWLRGKLGMSLESGKPNYFCPLNGGHDEKHVMFLPERLTPLNIEVIRNVYKNCLVEPDLVSAKNKLVERVMSTTSSNIGSATITTVTPSTSTTATIINTPITTPSTRTITTIAADEIIEIIETSLPYATQEAEVVSESRLLLSMPAWNGVGNMTLQTADLMCLADGQFINDTIVDFWLQFIISNLSDRDRARTHVFSTFFYKTLTTRPKRRSCAPWENDSKLTAAQKRHCRVKKWTKNVDIFSKDFIIIPMNENNDHWYLTIICFPGVTGICSMEDDTPMPHIRNKRGWDNRNVPKQTLFVEDKVSEVEDEILSSCRDEASIAESNEGVRNLPKVKQPCILSFDSRGEHPRDYATLREYIRTEYEIRKGDERSFDRCDMLGYAVHVTQETNHYDDGIYILAYVESFFSKPFRTFLLPLPSLRKSWVREDIIRTKRKEMYETICNLIKANNPENVTHIPRLEFKTSTVSNPSSSTVSTPTHCSNVSSGQVLTLPTETCKQPPVSKPVSPVKSESRATAVTATTAPTATSSNNSSRGPEQSVSGPSVPVTSVKSETTNPTVAAHFPIISSMRSTLTNPSLTIRHPVTATPLSTLTTLVTSTTTSTSSTSRSSLMKDKVGYWWNNEWKWKEK